jgi:hypothetical protein
MLGEKTRKPDTKLIPKAIQKRTAADATLTKLTTKGKFQTSTRAGKGNWRKRFIGALSDVPNVTHACDVAHISKPAASAEGLQA